MAQMISTMQSRITKEIIQQAKPVADTQQHILIIGEYGSGKSWLANRIHESSNRRNCPFNKINCYMLETDEALKKIYGYNQYADNGSNNNQGLFEKSNGGTLLLEGFDVLPEHLQKEILESVEMHKAHHIGSSDEISIDVRMMMSVNVNSYYNSQLKFNLLSSTLNIEPYAINYPPLRQRREEIIEMVYSFLQSDLIRRYDFSATEISPRALYLCIRYGWPGNVQQLKNAIEHAAIISAGNPIQPEHLPNSVKQGQPNQQELEYLERKYTYRMAEKQLIHRVIEKTSSLEESLEKLGLDMTTFKQKLKTYQIEPELI